MKWCFAVVVLACQLDHGAALAQIGKVNSRFDAVAKPYLPGGAFMGTVLVAEGNRVKLNRGYGMANLEWSIPNTPDVKFRIGSLTKQFTATLILLLQQDGKLNIEDPVGRYLPDAPKSWKKITLFNLLNHTSGIPDFTDAREFRTWSMVPHTPDDEIASFRNKPLEFEPGSKFSYSNSNYAVLGSVIERVGGKTYSEQLYERIFKPLEMHDTGLDRDDLILPKRAQGYSPGDHGLTPARSESMSVPWAAGSIYSTTGDLLRWEKGLFDGKILTAASLKAMTTPGKGNYGLGVSVVELDGTKVVTHDGEIEGFNTYLAYIPARKIAVVVLSNVNGDAPNAMGNQIVNAALWKAAETTK